MHFAYAIVFVALLSSFGVWAGQPEVISCESIQKGKPKVRANIKLVFQDQRLLSLKYENELVRSSEDGGPSCSVEAARGVDDVQFQDSKDVTVIRFASSMDYAGQPFTPKVIVINNRLYVTVLFDVTMAHSMFCGAAAGMHETVSYDRRSKTCGFNGF